MRRATHVNVLAVSANPLAQGLLNLLRQSAAYDWHPVDVDHAAECANQSTPDEVNLYIPSLASDYDGMIPDLYEARRFFASTKEIQNGTFILLSSALIYGIGAGRQGLATEDYAAPRNTRHCICDAWKALEEMARASLNQSVQLTVLRTVTVVPSPAWLSTRLSRRLVLTLPGHDPSLQLLSLSDLAEAVRCAIEQRTSGVFNVAPDGVVPVRAAVALSGRRRLPIPRTLQRLVKPGEQLEYLRYPWTVCNEKIKRELGFLPRKSSAAALMELRQSNHAPSETEPRFDEFGMDPNYIYAYGRTLFRFLHDYYWRIEVKGLEHVPRRGRGMLVGMHRGFMPFDGVMALHLVAREVGRLPRFLTHPSLLKFPFLANFMSKLGGVPAWQQNADFVLQRDELLGIFPEGIEGAFTRYRDAYRLQEFGRDAFVKLALRNRAPIIPFVTVGSAEIFPIFGRLNWRLWTRYTEWPYFPITATFPLLPLPLPSKWHTLFLPPISVEQYPPEAAQDPSVVKAISLDVRTKMQQAVDQMLQRRRSIFFGSIFGREGV
jgi:1-acyl-sn-glycerol-3-phosphate acyltransferase/nucleoside-diphosphate-sugar epimerase